MVPSISVIYTREAKDWNTKDPQSAYLDLNVPELTNYYVKQGVVNIAISFDGEKTYNALPATIDGISYNYDYATQSVRIYAQDPIFDGFPVDVPAKAVFKISLTDADWVQ